MSNALSQMGISGENRESLPLPLHHRSRIRGRLSQAGNLEEARGRKESDSVHFFDIVSITINHNSLIKS